MTAEQPRAEAADVVEDGPAPAKDEFHTDKMIIASAIVGVLSTLTFLAILILNYLYA